MACHEPSWLNRLSSASIDGQAIMRLLRKRLPHAQGAKRALKSVRWHLSGRSDESSVDWILSHQEGDQHANRLFLKYSQVA